MSLTAREVRLAIEDRINAGLYPPGSTLPSMRALAKELDASPSTISRALREVARIGLVDIRNRDGVTVARRQRGTRKTSAIAAETEAALRSLSQRWKIAGHDRAGFERLVTDALQQTYTAGTRVVFAECNRLDLTDMAASLRAALPDIAVEESLIDQLDVGRLRNAGAVVVAPYFHYREVYDRIGTQVPVYPVHFSVSADTLDAMLKLGDARQVIAVGINARAAERIASLVAQYLNCKVVKAVASAPARIAKLSARSDAVIGIGWLAEQLADVLGPTPFVPVRFQLDASVADLADLLVAKPVTAPPVN